MTRTWSRYAAAVATRFRPYVPLILGLLLFGGCALFRLTTASFTDDDYLHLSVARQLLAGDLPLRDFMDPGEPLFYSLSAAFQALVSHSLLGEAVLDVLLLSAGFTLAYYLAFHLTGSLAISWIAAAAGVVSYPRLYSYPKIFLPVLALMFIWRYVDTRRDRALVQVGLVAALVFLFRHDYGLYVACALIMTAVLVHWGADVLAWTRPVCVVGGTAAFVLLPYAVFVQVHKGIGPYLRTTIETGRAEHDRTEGSFPRFDLRSTPPVPVRVNVLWADDVTDTRREALAAGYRLSSPEYQGGNTWSYVVDDESRANIEAIVRDPGVMDTHNIDRATFTLVRVDRPNPNAMPWLYYLVIGLPILALVGVGRRGLARIKGTGRDGRMLDPGHPLTAVEIKVMGAAALQIAANAYLLRAATAVVIPDGSALSVVIGAWLVAVGFNLAAVAPTIPDERDRHAPRGRSVGALVRVAVTGIAIAITGLALTESSGGQALGLFAERLRTYGLTYVGDSLRALEASRAPFPSLAAQYVFACTDDTDRLLVTGYAPQLYYHAGRAFAGGRVYFNSSIGTSANDQRFSLERFQQEQVPIVLHPAGDDEFARTFAPIDAYLRERYRHAGAVDAFGAPFTVFVDRHRAPVSTFEPAGLPCFRRHATAGTAVVTP